MNDLDDAYRILNIAPDTPPQQLQQAYYQQAKQWYPGRYPTGSPQRLEAEAQFQACVDAYGEIITALLTTLAPTHSEPEAFDRGAQFFYEQAQAHAKARQDADALEDLNIAIRLQPDYAAAYTLRGQMNRLMGFTDRAAADDQQAQALSAQINTNESTPVAVVNTAVAPIAKTSTSASLIHQFKLGLILVFICALITITLASLSWLSESEEPDQQSSQTPGFAGDTIPALLQHTDRIL